jgi:hypothetical protein
MYQNWVCSANTVSLNVWAAVFFQISTAHPLTLRDYKLLWFCRFLVIHKTLHLWKCSSGSSSAQWQNMAIHKYKNRGTNIASQDPQYSFTLWKLNVYSITVLCSQTSLNCTRVLDEIADNVRELDKRESSSIVYSIGLSQICSHKIYRGRWGSRISEVLIHEVSLQSILLKMTSYIKVINISNNCNITAVICEHPKYCLVRIAANGQLTMKNRTFRVK